LWPGPVDRRTELVQRLDEHHSVADFRERPSGVAETPVVFAVRVVAEPITHQTESRPDSLEALRTSWTVSLSHASRCRGLTFAPSCSSAFSTSRLTLRRTPSGTDSAAFS